MLTLPSTGCRQLGSLVGTAWQQRHSWAEGSESTGESTGKSCCLLWAGPGNDGCFRFLHPTARPAGACWVQAGGGGSCCGSWGIDWEEESVFLSLCKSSDPRDVALVEVKRCRFESGWCGSSAAPGLPRGAGALWPPRCLLSCCPQSGCLSASTGSTQPALPCLPAFSQLCSGRWALERLYFCGCSLTCAFLLPRVAAVPM